MAYQTPPRRRNKPSMPKGKIDAAAMPFTAFAQRRAAGAPGTGSRSPQVLRDRAARLRAQAEARRAARMPS